MAIEVKVITDSTQAKTDLAKLKETVERIAKSARIKVQTDFSKVESNFSSVRATLNKPITLKTNLKTVASEAKDANTAMSELNSSVKSAGESFKSLAIGLVSLTAATTGIATFISLSDKLTASLSQLKQVSNTEGDLSSSFAITRDVALGTRTELSTVINLYRKLSAASADFGASQQQIGIVTQNISRSVATAGVDAASAAAALTQLGQGFASNRLGGDELRSVMEQLPTLAKQIADGIGVTIGQLRTLGEAGQLTGKTVFEGLLKQTHAINKEFANVGVTYSQAFTNIGNSFFLLFAAFKGIKSDGQGLPDLINAAAIGLAKFANNLEFHIASFYRFLGNIEYGIRNIGSMLDETLERFTGFSVLKVVAKFDIQQIHASDFFDKLGLVAKQVVDFTYTVERAFWWLYDRVIGHSWIPDLVQGVIDWMAKLLEAPLAYVDKFVDYASAQFEKLAGTKINLGKMFDISDIKWGTVLLGTLIAWQTGFLGFMGRTVGRAIGTALDVFVAVFPRLFQGIIRNSLKSALGIGGLFLTVKGLMNLTDTPLQRDYSPNVSEETRSARSGTLLGIGQNIADSLKRYLGPTILRVVDAWNSSSLKIVRAIKQIFGLQDRVPGGGADNESRVPFGPKRTGEVGSKRDFGTIVHDVLNSMPVEWQIPVVLGATIGAMGLVYKTFAAGFVRDALSAIVQITGGLTIGQSFYKDQVDSFIGGLVKAVITAGSSAWKAVIGDGIFGRGGLGESLSIIAKLSLLFAAGRAYFGALALTLVRAPGNFAQGIVASGEVGYANRQVARTQPAIAAAQAQVAAGTATAATIQNLARMTAQNAQITARVAPLVAQIAERGAALRTGISNTATSIGAGFAGMAGIEYGRQVAEGMQNATNWEKIGVTIAYGIGAQTIGGLIGASIAGVINAAIAGIGAIAAGIAGALFSIPGLILLVIGALALAWTNWEKLGPMLLAAWEKVKKDILDPFIAKMRPSMHTQQITPQLSAQVRDTSEPSGWFEKHVEPRLRSFTVVVENISTLISSKFNEALQRMQDILRTLFQPLVDFIDAFYRLKKAFESFNLIGFIAESFVSITASVLEIVKTKSLFEILTMHLVAMYDMAGKFLAQVREYQSLKSFEATAQQGGFGRSSNQEGIIQFGYTGPTGFERPQAQARASGGSIRGPGTSRSDSIPALLSDGEFVVNAAATSKNRSLLESINSGRRYADGGFVFGDLSDAEITSALSQHFGAFGPTQLIPSTSHFEPRPFSDLSETEIRRALLEHFGGFPFRDDDADEPEGGWPSTRPPAIAPFEARWQDTRAGFVPNAADFSQAYAQVMGYKREFDTSPALKSFYDPKIWSHQLGGNALRMRYASPTNEAFYFYADQPAVDIPALDNEGDLGFYGAYITTLHEMGHALDLKAQFENYKGKDKYAFVHEYANEPRILSEIRAEKFAEDNDRFKGRVASKKADDNTAVYNHQYVAQHYIHDEFRKLESVKGLIEGAIELNAANVFTAFKDVMNVGNNIIPKSAWDMANDGISNNNDNGRMVFDAFDRKYGGTLTARLDEKRDHAGYKSLLIALLTNFGTDPRMMDRLAVRRATGGMIYGEGGPTDDKIPALLSNGEFVVRASAVKGNRALLEMINNGKISKFSAGSPIASSPEDVKLLFNALVKREGSGSEAVSSKGATGAAQIIKSTFDGVNKEFFNGSKNFAIEADRLEVAHRHVQDLATKYNGSVIKVAAAYHGGPGSMDKDGNIIPTYREKLLDKDGKDTGKGTYTKDYAATVAKYYEAAKGGTASTMDGISAMFTNFIESIAKLFDQLSGGKFDLAGKASAFFKGKSGTVTAAGGLAVDQKSFSVPGAPTPEQILKDTSAENYFDVLAGLLNRSIGGMSGNANVTAEALKDKSSFELKNIVSELSSLKTLEAQAKKNPIAAAELKETFTQLEKNTKPPQKTASQLLAGVTSNDEAKSLMQKQLEAQGIMGVSLAGLTDSTEDLAMLNSIAESLDKIQRDTAQGTYFGKMAANAERTALGNRTLREVPQPGSFYSGEQKKLSQTSKKIGEDSANQFKSSFEGSIFKSLKGREKDDVGFWEEIAVAYSNQVISSFSKGFTNFVFDDFKFLGTELKTVLATVFGEVANSVNALAAQVGLVSTKVISPPGAKIYSPFYENKGDPNVIPTQNLFKEALTTPETTQDKVSASVNQKINESVNANLELYSRLSPQSIKASLGPQRWDTKSVNSDVFSQVDASFPENVASKVFLPKSELAIKPITFEGVPEVRLANVEATKVTPEEPKAAVEAIVTPIIEQSKVATVEAVKTASEETKTAVASAVAPLLDQSKAATEATKVALEEIKVAVQKPPVVPVEPIVEQTKAAVVEAVKPVLAEAKAATQATQKPVVTAVSTPQAVEQTTLLGRVQTGVTEGWKRATEAVVTVKDSIAGGLTELLRTIIAAIDRVTAEIAKLIAAVTGKPLEVTAPTPIPVAAAVSASVETPAESTKNAASSGGNSGGGSGGSGAFNIAGFGVSDIAGVASGMIAKSPVTIVGTVAKVLERLNIFGTKAATPDGKGSPNSSAGDSSLKATLDTGATSFGKVLSEAWTGLRKTLDNGWADLTKALNSAWGFLKGLFQGGGIGGSAGGGGLLSGIGGLLNFGSTGVSAAAGGVGPPTPGFLDEVGGWLSSVFKFSDGGAVYGPGSGTSDSIMAMLSNGEFVVNAKSAGKYRNLLQSINSGNMPKFADGGLVSNSLAPTLPSAAVSKSLIATHKQPDASATTVHINITGDISRQTRREIIGMLPQITTGVNMQNRELGHRG